MVSVLLVRSSEWAFWVGVRPDLSLVPGVGDSRCQEAATHLQPYRKPVPTTSKFHRLQTKRRHSAQHPNRSSIIHHSPQLRFNYGIGSVYLTISVLTAVEGQSQGLLAEILHSDSAGKAGKTGPTSHRECSASHGDSTAAAEPVGWQFLNVLFEAEAAAVQRPKRF